MTAVSSPKGAAQTAQGPLDKPAYADRNAEAVSVGTQEVEVAAAADNQGAVSVGTQGVDVVAMGVGTQAEQAGMEAAVSVAAAVDKGKDLLRGPVQET